LLSEETREKYFTNSKKDDDENTLKYYRHPEMPESLFFETTLSENSYSGEDEVTHMRFVEGVQKTVTIYEPI
jgi:hypothetical protein